MAGGLVRGDRDWAGDVPGTPRCRAPIAYPASFGSAGLTETWTFRVMQRMAVEFEQVQRGGRFTGFGYSSPFQACM